MIIPHRPRNANQQQVSSPPPPPTVYSMMAATQMHEEGRLLAKDQSGSDAKINSIPEPDQSPVRA